LQALEQAAHTARKLDSDRAREAMDLACIIGERLRSHLAAKCDHCARNSSLVVDLIDIERASAEIVVSLGVLAELARTGHFEPDPALLEMLTETARGAEG
jgi:hypothetical protein